MNDYFSKTYEQWKNLEKLWTYSDKKESLKDFLGLSDIDYMRYLLKIESQNFSDEKVLEAYSYKEASNYSALILEKCFNDYCSRYDTFTREKIESFLDYKPKVAAFLLSGLVTSSTSKQGVKFSEDEKSVDIYEYKNGETSLLYKGLTSSELESYCLKKVYFNLAKLKHSKNKEYSNSYAQCCNILEKKTGELFSDYCFEQKMNIVFKSMNSKLNSEQKGNDDEEIVLDF